jgi:hypothetical protein
MTLIIQKPTGAKLNLRQTWQPMDSDAAAYITAVETADGQALEERTKIAIDNFVLGCKADGIWNAIKASCILAGARTRLGALTPLTGAAPTAFNFVDADYNRKTGLKGNGSNKNLDSGRNENSDPRDNCHVSVFATAAETTNTRHYIGSNGNSQLRIARSNASAVSVRNRNATDFTQSWNLLDFAGSSRASSSAFVIRTNQVSSLISSNAASTPSAIGIGVFSFGTFSPSLFSDARLAFYSIGESLDLALLDARVTDLINAFAAAIP